VDLPTRLDLYQIGRNYVLSKATKIDPTQIDTQGSDVNIFVGVAAHLSYQVILQLGYSSSRMYLDAADDEDLVRIGWDRFQISPKQAAAALGVVRFFRSVSGVGGTIPTGTKLQSLTGIEYVLISDAVFAAGDVEQFADVRAVQAGKESQVGKNQIRKFSNISQIFDQTIQLTNDDPTAHGESAESSDEYRERIRSEWRASRRGILAAIEQGALTVPGVVSAQAIEALDSTGFPARIVNLYVADSSGVASRPIVNQILAALLEYRAGGIKVLVNTSIPQIVDVQLHPTFQANVNTTQLTDQLRAAVVEYVNSLAVNAPLYRAKLNSALARFTSLGLIPNDQTIVAPTGDLIPALGKTLRTTLSNVTVV
jgi:hypothetical protein